MKIELIDYQKPTIQALLTNRRYRVPKYQRPFAWGRVKAEKFWDDIFNEDEDYFMGTTVLNKCEGYYEIVDGQQRITTISLFFLALYLVYKEAVDEGQARMYIYKYLKSGNLRDEYQILSLSKNNDLFYNNLVNISSKSDLALITSDSHSNANILDIVNFFIDKLAENRKTDPNLEKNRLTDIIEKIEGRVFFIEIIVPNYKQASKLFEVLNNRGTNLVKSDLVRNYLLSEVERQNFTEAEMLSWENIEDNVGSNNLEKFMRYSSLLLSLKDDLYERIIEYTDATSSKTSIDLLKELSQIYKKIIDPSSFAEDDLESKLLTELSILGITQAHSVLLAGYYKFSKEDSEKLLQFIINFTFRYSTICGKNPNKLENKYATLAYKIFNEGLLIEGVKSQVLELTLPEEEFDNSFINKNFKNTKFPRYILGKIENKISTEEKIVDFSAVHLEHVMPKKIDKWIEVDAEYSKIYSKYVDNIGNMVLLSKTINTSIKNSFFDLKKEKYDGSEINLVNEIKLKTKWDLDEIKWNRDRYLVAAKEIWKI